MNYRRYICIFIAILIFSSLGFPQARQKLPVVQIGTVLDGDYELNEAYLSFFLKEIIELTRGEFDIKFPKDKLILADWTAKGVKAAMDRLL
ncbi:MAG: hypothetical protein GTN76_02730, partial [Candidatus Aenigmarchaeota archaeon]|nr:hypothetical protein [Candidatus Aenigmarchaeota archaeon]